MEIIDGLISPLNSQHLAKLNEKGVVIYPTDNEFYEHLYMFGITLEMLFEKPTLHAEAFLNYLVKNEIELYFSEQGKNINSLVIDTDGTGFYLVSVETTEEVKTEILELLS